ncbi:Protein ACCELERATED CELL DEATH 6 [Camellia lanceoleosa]|nr:Protein ACCELERATED CELL DEATH 6 [Camellia lanceoleosa]
MAFNKGNQTPLDVTTQHENVALVTQALKRSESKERGRSLGWRNIISDDNENLTKKMKVDDKRKRFTPTDIKKTEDTHMIVAALIATVTFAAGFTMPGGYNGNQGPTQGMAILTRETTFQAFAVTNTIAMILSTSAIVTYFFGAPSKDRDKLLKHHNSAANLVMVATVAMVVAFITGTYAVLEHSRALAIAVCITSCLFFWIFNNLFKEKLKMVIDRPGEAPLYITAEKGCHAVVSEILKPFRAPAYGGPGGTALHAAVISNNQGSTNTLLDSKKDLVKEPDMYGWTPLHYAARFGHVQRAKQLLQLGKYIAYVIADKDDMKTALHVAATHEHQTGSINIRPIRMPANITKSRETNLIVATLIATVTFTAGITMPGGYINDNKDPNQGMAILTRKAAFIAFVITDTIALTLSVFAVLTQLYTMTDHPILLKKQLGLAFCHTAYAMIAMWLAFITGTYAVLAPSSLSISVCVIPSILLFNYLFHIMQVVAPLTLFVAAQGQVVVPLTLFVAAHEQPRGQIGLAPAHL